MAARLEKKMADDHHSYAKVSDCRTPSFIHDHHEYAKAVTPSKRKRVESSPTGKTPTQLAKQQRARELSVVGRKLQNAWTQKEKDELQTFRRMHSSTGASQKEIWDECATQMNKMFPGKSRTGDSCRKTFSRLDLSAVSEVEDDTLVSKLLVETASKATQTEPALPVSDLCLPEVPRWGYLGKEKVSDTTAPSTKLLFSVLNKEKPTSITADNKQVLIDTILHGTVEQLATVVHSITPLHEALKKMILQDVEEEARNASSRKSVLAQKTFTDLVGFKWDNIVEEMVGKQLFLTEVLLAVCLPTAKRSPQRVEALVPVVATIYGMLMKARFQELSLVQQVLSIALANEQTHQKVYDRLQPLGITMCHSSVLRAMDLMSGHFNDQLIESVKSQKRYRLVGDNINFQIGVHNERKGGSQKHIEHWFGSAAIIQNVAHPQSGTAVPQKELARMHWTEFLPDEKDFDKLITDYCVLVGRILVKHLPSFKPYTEVVSRPIMGECSEALKVRNKVVPLPALPKNEQKYADVVHILDQYESVVTDVAQKAGVTVEPVHIGGDQLTRERFSGAKRLRACALSDSERFEHLTPITFELFHLQMSFLTLFYQVLYRTNSTEAMTLHAQKIRLMRRDADGNDVKNHYHHCKELAESFTSAYVVEAARHFFDLENTDSEVDLGIPENVSTDTKADLLYGKIRPFVETMVIAERLEQTKRLLTDDETYQIVYPDGTIQIVKVVNSPEEEREPDYMMKYGENVLALGLLFLQLDDIVSMPDRDRLLPTMKVMMLEMKGHNNRSKYALEILRFLAHQLALFSERTAHESCYGLFVNTKGKMDSHIPADLQMEHLVRLTKKHLKAMCSNVDESSIVKRSAAFYGMCEVADRFDVATGVVRRAHRHKTKQSVSDEQQIIEDLRLTKPFLMSNNRIIPSIGRCCSPISKLKKEDLLAWIQSHKLSFTHEIGR